MAVIEIDSIEKLVAFSNGDYGRGDGSNYLDVVLTADLDFADLTEYDVPYNWAGCTGTWYINFNGQNHKIDNIYYMGTAHWGFFNTLYGTVKNLKLTNLYITSAVSLAAVCFNLYGTLTNVHVSGHIESLNTNNEQCACGIYVYARSGKVEMCSVSGLLKSAGTALGIGLNGTNGYQTYIFSCLIHADIVASGNNGCSGIPFTSVYTTIVNCEYNGNIKCPNGAKIHVGSYQNTICNTLLIYGAGSVGTWSSSSTYYNVYYDSTLAAEGGFTPPSITGAPTTDLQDGQWLHDHGIAT